MKNYETTKTLAIVSFLAFATTMVCFWDIFGLKVSGWEYYYPFKLLSIGVLYLTAFLVYKKKISNATAFDLVIIDMYIYSYVGVTYLHATYIFSFYEVLTVNCLIYINSFRRYALVTSFGLGLTALSILHMPEPDFVKAGYSIRMDLLFITFIFGLVTFLVYWFFNRQRKIILDTHERFSSIGRQAMFLLHELKSPLGRFMSKGVDQKDRDALYIYSIVSGVESLIKSPESLRDEFAAFDWQRIEDYLNTEFRPTCEALHINLEIQGFSGQGFGQIITLQLALRNLVKNAIEAISMEADAGAIRILKNSHGIHISNSGRSIPSDDAQKFFSPFYSEKKSRSNFGVGLNFVEHVIEAHGGKVEYQQEENWNTFKVSLV